MLKCLILSLLSASAFAHQVTVSVNSNQDTPVYQAVVYVQSEQTISTLADTKQVSVMDQIDRQFVPHILAVQRGTQVVFPNSDSIKHHVYSFSDAKPFELKLYKDINAPPMQFGTAGEVELGCNVHDWMLAYIWVVDTPYFAKTDKRGNALLNVPEGNYTLKVWHPHIQDKLDSLEQVISVERNHNINLVLKQDLLEDPSHFKYQTDEFADYD
jgi:plastocyanin